MTRTTIEVMAALCAVTQSLPVGTNLTLLQFLWMLVSGQLLPSRGALFPGLKAIGLSTAAIRRAWAAFRYGAWRIALLLTLWHKYVTEQPHWQALQHEGYVPMAVDITAYWRPALEGCASKHYHPQAGKALQAVEFGLIGRVGQVNGQRVTLLTAVLRGDLTDASSAPLAARLLKRVAVTAEKGSPNWVYYIITRVGEQEYASGFPSSRNLWFACDTSDTYENQLHLLTASA